MLYWKLIDNVQNWEYNVRRLSIFVKIKFDTVIRNSLRTGPSTDWHYKIHRTRTTPIAYTLTLHIYIHNLSNLVPPRQPLIRPILPAAFACPFADKWTEVVAFRCFLLCLCPFFRGSRTHSLYFIFLEKSRRRYKARARTNTRVHLLPSGRVKHAITFENRGRCNGITCEPLSPGCTRRWHACVVWKA